MVLENVLKIKEKKGAMMDIFIWLILIFVNVVFFGIWVYTFGIVADRFAAIPTPVGGTNISLLAQDSIGRINAAQNVGIEILGVGMLIMFGLSTIISNYFVKAHPVFIIVYLFIIVTAIILSVYLSNTYETLMTIEPLGTTFTNFSAISFMMLNLPIITGVIGFVGMIFMFAGILRDEGAGGSLT